MNKDKCKLFTTWRILGIALIYIVATAGCAGQEYTSIGEWPKFHSAAYAQKSGEIIVYDTEIGVLLVTRDGRQKVIGRLPDSVKNYIFAIVPSNSRSMFLYLDKYKDASPTLWEMNLLDGTRQPLFSSNGRVEAIYYLPDGISYNLLVNSDMKYSIIAGKAGGSTKVIPIRMSTAAIKLIGPTGSGSHVLMSEKEDTKQRIVDVDTSSGAVVPLFSLPSAESVLSLTPTVVGSSKVAYIGKDSTVYVIDMAGKILHKYMYIPSDGIPLVFSSIDFVRS